MAEQDKKTQIGTLQPRNATPVGASPTPAPASIAGSQAPGQAAHATSYLPPAADPLIGMLLAGRYTITKKLGEGGMGAVYLAQHNLLEKSVALKLLHGEFARKPDLVERFMQEAKAASRIRHENVIDISDFGKTEDGLVFFAMELLKGHDLHEEIARARLAGQLLPWSRSKKIFLQICSALSAAHGKGIIHRDLKPENIYLVEFLGEPDFVKLLDFGIAKLTEVNEEGRKLTRTGMLFGTPEYMSPEQARGENVDHRVDVYAMGCILFQLVTGRVPFEADNFMGVLSMHLTEAPPSIPPEVFDRIGAPRELAYVIDRALLKNRDERFGTMDELANAVRQVSGDPIVVSDASRPTPAPMVQAPQRTTESRQAEARTTTTNRNKTAWTGNLQVPIEEGVREQPKSKLPLILAVLVILGGGAAAGIYFATRNSDAPKQVVDNGSGTASGSQAAVVTPPPPPPPPVTIDAGVAKTVEQPLPKQVTIHLDSVPSNAVIDVGDNKVHHTPLTFKVPGSHDPRQFSIKLNGYQEAMIEIVPDQTDITYKETLIKGAGGAAPVVHQVPRVPTPVGSGSATAGVVTAPVPDPEVKKPPDPEVKKPPDPKDQKPPEVPKKDPQCMPDPNDPNGGCLKSFPPAP